MRPLLTATAADRTELTSLREVRYTDIKNTAVFSSSSSSVLCVVINRFTPGFRDGNSEENPGVF